ncbi:MAG: competence/damage-inducible protein A [Bacteroidales bacterium]|nr:competence/damage-inducible protein A [Bacteroidales bacterium]
MILINIGDELLIGQVVNTNAAFVGQQMAMAGIEMTEVLTIGDAGDAIRDAIVSSFEKTDLIIMTGGLGPTKDDITKKVVCDLYHKELVMDEATLQAVTQRFADRCMALTETNRQQAAMPEGSVVLPNALGTAPGLWIEEDGKVLIMLPGVPFEMERLVKEEVLPRLQARRTDHHVIQYRVLQCTNITESGLSDLLEEYERQLPENLSLAYLPKPGIIRLRLTGRGEDSAALQETLDIQFQLLKQFAGEYAFADEDIEVEEVVGKLLLKRNCRLATAESCTGGYIAHLITSVPGSSQYFQGSVVSYSNEVKRDILNVREDNLRRRGAVSEEVVSDMALNVMGLLDVDYSVATSGIAGPDGGTEEKPVGTVWIAVATPVRLVTQKFQFGKRMGRQQIIERAARAALNMLRIEIEKDIR